MGRIKKIVMSIKNKKLKQENVKRILQAQRMTAERLRTFPGLEDLKEHEAVDLIEQMQNYCDAIVKLLSKKKEQ